MDCLLHRSEMTRKLKVGEMVEGRITFKRDDGRVNVSMRPTKEKALVSDGDIIMEYLLNRGGKMPYSDESSAMLIKDKFNISKAAFKRALGHLMKEKKLFKRMVGHCLPTLVASGHLLLVKSPKIRNKDDENCHCRRW